MKLTSIQICIVLSWAYAAVVAAWFGLNRLAGDALWWLALLNAFVPYLFLPLVVLLPLCFFCRREAFWLSVLPPVVVFLLVYGTLFLPKVSLAAEGDPTLTVMTFNLWGGSETPETARVILDQGAPDLVVLQELTPYMAGILLEEMGDLYPYYLFEPDRDYKGSGLLSRYPMTPIDVGHLDNPDWHIQAVEVAVDGESVTLYNVHPYATNPLYYFEIGADIPTAVAASFRNRLQAFEGLIADLDRREGPVLVAGDFNCTDQSDVYTLMRSRLHDAHRAAGWGFGHTFPAYGGSFRGIPILPRQMRIDMVFYSEDWVAFESRVGLVYGESDHLPLIVHLGWK